MWKKHLERDDSRIVGEEGALAWLHEFVEASYSTFRFFSHRPVLRTAAQLSALLGVLTLLQHF